MARVRDSDARRVAAEKLAATVARKGVKAKPRMRPLAVVKIDVDRRLKSGDWSGATALEMVELYCWCHERVYGVRPPELDQKGARGSKERLAACGSVNAMTASAFDGSEVALVGYMRWAWAREEAREKKARAESKERGRLSWRALFVARFLLGDYLAAREAKKAASR